MFRTALIALALVLALAACVSDRAANTDSASHARASTPLTITCKFAVNGAPPGAIITIPPGKNPTDVCPGSAITIDFGPDTIYHIPWAPAGSAPPAVRSKTGKPP